MPNYRLPAGGGRRRHRLRFDQCAGAAPRARARRQVRQRHEAAGQRHAAGNRQRRCRHRPAPAKPPDTTIVIPRSRSREPQPAAARPGRAAGAQPAALGRCRRRSSPRRRRWSFRIRPSCSAPRRGRCRSEPFAALGVRTGAFLVLPAVEVTGGYDTNPARTCRRRASWFRSSRPNCWSNSDWSRHEVTATLRGSYTAYDSRRSTRPAGWSTARSPAAST